jgi:hypothetical protein
VHRNSGFAFIVILMIVLVGCQPQTTNEPTPEPLALLTEASNNIRESETFRMYVEQSGATYIIPVYLGPTDTLAVNAQFRWARAQYVAPGILQATARIVVESPVGEVAQDVEIFSRETEQWFRLQGAPWIDGDFAPGFNPVTLIADDSGFQAALTALQELEFVGGETLEDGSPVYHLKGIANGPAVKALVVGLIDVAETVPLDVYIHRDQRIPVRIVLTQPETATEESPEPTTWTINVYDVNAAPELTPPDEADSAATEPFDATESVEAVTADSTEAIEPTEGIESTEAVEATEES